MKREEAKEYILQQEPTFLAKARRKGYVCPCCGNGTGKDGSGISKNKNGKYKCFKCGMYGDILDLFGHAKQITNPADIFKEAYAYYGVIIDEDPPNPSMMPYYKECMKRNDGSYLEKRGISLKTQQHFMVGYDPAWIHPLIKRRDDIHVKPSPRCIIPTSEYSYLARDTRENIPSYQKKYEKSKYGTVRIYNQKILELKDVIFVTEGEIDAMSVYEAGEHAIGLGSASNIRILADLCKDLPRKTFILMLDHDKAGKKAEDELGIILKDLGHYVAIGYYNGKDPNNALMKDRENFCRRVRKMAKQAVVKSREIRLEEINQELDKLLKEKTQILAAMSA